MAAEAILRALQAPRGVVRGVPVEPVRALRHALARLGPFVHHLEVIPLVACRAGDLVLRQAPVAQAVALPAGLPVDGGKLPAVAILDAHVAGVEVVPGLALGALVSEVADTGDAVRVTSIGVVGEAVLVAVLALGAVPVLAGRAVLVAAVHPQRVAGQTLRAVPLEVVVEEVARLALWMALELLRVHARMLHDQSQAAPAQQRPRARGPFRLRRAAAPPAP
mmetsp:Transcript_51620/g.144101  ORF Transcript_51620/g.144101 Transcript_51620/m.144101 type:complete len:221 (+) Transcript_51620:399-1061(+)